MHVSYYDALLPVQELSGELKNGIADLSLPYRAHASVRLPGGRIVVAFVSDSAQLGSMFADHWAHAGTGREPDATLYALTRPARGYGLDGAWDRARWWSPGQRAMVVFGFGSYRLVKVCIRGICSAVSGDDILFMHGCTLSVGAGSNRRGVVITGSSGVGKTALVAQLLDRADCPITVLNDDWGAVSLGSGKSVSTGEKLLHMKSSSVLALRPGFFTVAPPDSYSYDLSEPDRTTRVLVSPESVYGASWDSADVVVEHVAVVVRELPGWSPPRERAEVARELKSVGYVAGHQHHEAFFNGSLILMTAEDELREERRYQRLLDRVTVSWVNNCDTPGMLADSFISAVMK